MVTGDDDDESLLLSRHHDLQRAYYANIKPPSVPSSDSSTGSDSPIILDRCRFFGENFEYVIILLLFLKLINKV